MNKPRVFHPFLFAIFPILFLFANNVNELYNSASRFLPIHILISVGASAILFLLAWLITKKDLIRAGALASIIIFTFFSYGYFFDALKGLLGANIIRHRYIIPIAFVVVLSALIFLLRTKKSLIGLTKVLNVISGVLVFISLFTVIQFSLGSKSQATLESFFEIDKDQLQVAEPENAYPDIYYIVLDGYANSSVLESFYDFDNKEFLDFLRAKGFFVAQRSTSNYGYTYASLASALNMSYLDQVSNYVGEDSEDLNPLGYLIENNVVTKFLKDQGYTYVHLSSGYPMTNFNRNADVSFREGLDRFSLFLLNSTVLRPVVDPTSPWRLGFSKDDEVRKRVLFEIATLHSIPDRKDIRTPRFVFAHIVSPHQPYVFDQLGNPVQSRDRHSPDERTQRYKEQLIFINSRMESVVSSLLDKSNTPPIIIFQSDHGAQPPRASGSKGPYRLHNFTAIYTPDNTQYDFYNSITPVNTFRLTFNGLFGTNLSILEDKVFSAKEYYEFIDVTQEVRKNRF